MREPNTVFHMKIFSSYKLLEPEKNVPCGLKTQINGCGESIKCKIKFITEKCCVLGLHTANESKE